MVIMMEVGLITMKIISTNGCDNAWNSYKTEKSSTVLNDKESIAKIILFLLFFVLEKFAMRAYCLQSGIEMDI